MSSASVLLAETDPHTLDHLPRILSTHFPQVVVDICTSAEDLRRKNDLTSYDTIAMSPILLQNYRLLKYKADRRLLTPLLVTASFKDRLLASTYLQKDAFDLIIKPIVPHEAARTLRLALWQSKLLQLLASKERAWARFQEHMDAFPHAVKAENEFASKLAAYERTFQALRNSMRHLLSTEEKCSLFDIAGFVERLTRQRALDRLLTMIGDETSH